MPRRRDGGLVPGTPALAGEVRRRAGEEATDSIMALQMPVAQCGPQAPITSLPRGWRNRS
jgi:hypothetical protein